MSRRRMRAIATTAVGVVLFGTACTMLAMPSARADAGSPQDFLALGLFAEAGGERVVFTQAATTQPNGFAEADMPFAHAELNTAKSYGLTSAAWPGTGVGNIGAFIVLVGGPDQAEPLKDPVRAEAESNQGPSTVTQAFPSASSPGITMTVTALPTKSTAHSEMVGSENPAVGTVGPTEATTETAITGRSTVRSTASSAIRNLSLGPGGLVSIASVTSTATVTANATTSGTSAVPSGGTAVTGMKVAGFPVTVDQDGVHAQGHGFSQQTANDQINKALAQTQTQIFLARPTTTTSPSGMTYDAGSLYISFGDGKFYVELGGATAIAGASNTTTYTPPAGPPLNSGIPPVPPAVPSGSAPALGSGTAPLAPPGSAPLPQTAPPGQPNLRLAASPIRWPGSALAPGWLIAAIAGAGLIAFGLRRLPDRLLEQTATPCPLGDTR